MHDSRRDGDAGFTLSEVMVVITVIAIVAATLTGVFSVIVRNTEVVQARADDARSVLGLSTWFPSDASSTPNAPLSAPGEAWDREPSATSGCAGATAGINLLRMSWTESFGTTATTTRYTAAYRFVDDGTGWKIKRYSCVNSGRPAITNMTSTLPEIDASTWVAGSSPVSVMWTLSGSTIVGASMLVDTVSGDRVRIDGASNNPAATLPPLDTVLLEPATTLPLDPIATSIAPPPVSPSTTSAPHPSPTTTTSPTSTGTTSPGPTSTTSTTSTTEPAPTTVPCAAAIVSVDPSPVRNQQSNGSKNDVVTAALLSPVTVTVAKSGGCTNLGLEYVPVASGSSQWKPFGTSLQVIIAATAIEPWTDGTHVLRLRDGQAGPQVGATANLVVT